MLYYVHVKGVIICLIYISIVRCVPLFQTFPEINIYRRYNNIYLHFNYCTALFFFCYPFLETHFFIKFNFLHEER